MTIRCRTAVAAGSLLLSTGSAGLAQQRQPAQRGGPPGPNTPYILVTAFATSNKKLAVEAADELRKRIQSEHSAKDLYAVPKNQIETTLSTSGYPVDSALSVSDLMELSRNMHGEYVIAGTATKTGNGDAVRLETRILLRTGTTTLAQPLPPVDGKDVGDAAKLVERALAEALKGMPNYRDCISSLRAQDYKKAEQDARLGLAAYSRSVLSRVCLLQAQSALKEAPDSIIATATAILSSDSTSLFALASLGEAYKTKGDTANLIATDLRIARLDPLNPTATLPIIDELVNFGAVGKAIDLMNPLLKENPSDAALLKKKWQLLIVSAKSTPDGYKQAMTAGEALAKADPAEVTVDYFKRQIGTAQSDTNSAKAFEYASQGALRFPKEATFQLIAARTYIKQGKFQQVLDASRQVLEVDAKNVAAAQYVVYALNQLGQTDSILPAAKAMIAGGIPVDSLAAAVAAPVAGTVIAKAQASRTRADWENALKNAEAVDAVVPSPQTKFYIGVAAYSIVGDLVPHLQTLSSSTKAAARAQGCAEAKQAEDLLAKTAIAMPRGAAVNKDAAAQILTGVNSAGEYVTQQKKALCK